MRTGDHGRLLAEDVRFEAPGRWSVRGATTVERAVRHHDEVEFHARLELVVLVADDRRASAELVFVGTHTGEYEGCPPTGNAVRVPLAMVFEVDGRLISAMRIHSSPEQLLEQLRERRGPQAG